MQLTSCCGCIHRWRGIHRNTQVGWPLGQQITIYKRAFHLHLKSSLSRPLLLTPLSLQAHPPWWYLSLSRHNSPTWRDASRDLGLSTKITPLLALFSLGLHFTSRPVSCLHWTFQFGVIVAWDGGVWRDKEAKWDALAAGNDLSNGADNPGGTSD